MNNRHFLQIFSLSIKYLICLILFGSISVSFAQESDPVGSDQGNIEITSDGQPVWNLPITVPPGVLGLAPKLSLSVSAQGQLNSGGLSSISRCPGSVADHGSFKPVRFLLSDQYCLDGQPLVLISGTQGSDGSIYHTKIESFQKIQAQGSQGNGPSSFVVTTRNGSKLIYGETASSKTVTDNSTAVSWGISRLEDLSGNGLWYQYENISNTQSPEIALTKIVYGSKTQGAAPVEVSFNFENRPDTSSGYQLGNLVQNTKRLESITTNSDSKTARIFRISYEQAQPGNYSRVNNVSECAIDDESTEVCYRPSEFSYASSNTDWQANTSINQPDLLQDEKGRARGTLIDINNDGWTDWLTAVQTETGAAEIQTWLGSQNGWTSSTTFELPGPLFDYQINAEGIPVGNLADMNGDGLVDYFQAYHQTHPDGTKTIKRTTWLNTGEGFTVNAALRPPYYTVVIRIDGTIEAYDKYVDINGDGLPDQVRAMRRKSGSYSRVTRLNTGSGWAVSTDYKIPSGIFSDHSIGSQGAFLSELIDINGDGLVDFVLSAKVSDTVTHTRTYLNTGSGWENSNAFKMPTPLMDYSVHDKGIPNAELADINGDGLIDVWQALSFGNGEKKYNAWLNTGEGFSNSNIYKPTQRGTYIRNSGVILKYGELMDVNGNGKPEFVTYALNESSNYTTSVVYEHNGSTWVSNTSLKSYLPSIPFYIQPADSSASRALLQTADLDGDGRAETFVSNGYTGQQQVFSVPQPAAGELAGAMTEHVNGLGVATRLSYGISTLDSDLYTSGDITENSYPEAFVNSPMGLVKSVRKMDGLVHPNVAYSNENNGWYNVEHQYQGYKVDTSGRGSLGFSGRTISDARTGVSISSEFFQSYPFTGMPKNMVNTRNGIVNSRSDSEVAQKALYSDKTIFPYTSSTEANAYEPASGNLISVTETSSTYDDYGNTTSKVKTTRTQDQSQAFSTETLTTYKAVNDQTWILGLPSKTEVIHTSVIDGITDSQKNTTTATYNAKGYPLAEILEPGGDQIQTEYQYDSFGNVKKTIIRAGGESRDSSTTYASQGRFPKTSVNSLGHTATVTIDSRWGKPTQQKDPNNVTKQTKYDGFGTVLREDVLWDGQAQGSEVALAYWCEGRYKSRCTSHSTSAVYFAAALDDKGESPQSVYYDAYGRELVKQTSGADLNDNDIADGTTIYIKTVYDSEGRKIKTSRPSTTPNQFIYNIVDYDQYGRVKAKYLESASGIEKNKVGYIYNGLSITTKTSNQDHLSETTVVNDLRGKPVKAIDADNTVTKYSYDAKGNLLVTEVEGRTDTAISLTYDKFGRKIAMSDPDMGDWSYAYDSFGNLVEQTDAKGQQVTMVYDVLNRLTSRIEPEGTTTWHYDTPVQGNQEAAIGKLMHVSAPHDAYSRVHFYDKAMRPARERTNINGVAYYSERGYYRGSQRVAWEEYPSGLVLTKDYDPTGFPMKLESVDLNKYEDYLDAVYDYEDNVKEAKLLETENKVELDYYRDLIEGEVTEFDEYGVLVPDGEREGGLNADIQEHLNDINGEVAKAQRWIGLANDTASVLGQHTKWKNDYYAVYKASYLDPYNFNKDKAEYHAGEAQRLGNLANQENNKANNYLSQAQSKVNEANNHLNSAKGNWRAACIAGGKENHDKLSGALGLNCAFGPSVDGQRFSQFGLGNGRKNACFRLSTHNDRDGTGPYYKCAQYVNAFSWLPTDSRQIRTGTTREYVCNGSPTTPPGGGGGGGGGSQKSIIYVAGAIVAGIATFVEQAFGEAQDNCYWRDRHSTQTVQLLRNANFGSVTSNMDAVGPKMDQYAAKMNQAQSFINSAKPHQDRARNYTNQANSNANTAETYANTANTYVNGLQTYGALWVSHQNVEAGFGDRYDAYFNSYEVYAGKYECKKPADIPASVLYRTNDTVTYKPSPFANGIRVSLDDDLNFVPASEVAGRDDITVWYIDHNTRRLARAIEVPKFEKEHCKTGELWAHLDDGTIGRETNQLFASNLLFNRDYYLYQYHRFSNPINELVEQANDQLELVEELRDTYKNNAKVYWEALAYESDGQIKSARYGNDVENTWDYDESGRAGVIRAAKDSTILQNMIFHYDNVGNLISREDNSVSGKHFSETFTYDALSRLSTATLNGQGADLYQLTGNQAQSFDYDILGNITQKSDVGNYDYNAGSCLPGSFEGGPHAVKSTSGAINTSFCYDLNGNQISGYDRTLEYYSYNKPSMIDKIGGRSEFAYGPERQLIYQTETVDQQSRETAYVGNIYERTTKDGGASYESVHHLTMSGHTIAVLKTQSLDRTVGTSPYTFIETSLGTQKSLNYLHQDHLDSVVMITDEDGDVVERNHYDAFGKKRMIVPNGQILAAGLLPITDRSFTDHRYLVGQELIHMKGRVYDPTFGRFLSADPFIQSPLNSQSLNRYSYVVNNPLSLTDPSGYIFGWLTKLFKKILKIVKKIIKKIVAVIKKVIKAIEKVITKIIMALPMEIRIIAAIVVAVYAPYLATQVWAGAAGTFATIGGIGLSAGGVIAAGAIGGALSGLILTGTLKGALIGGLTGAAFAGVGNFFSNAGGAAGRLGFVKQVGHIGFDAVSKITTLGRVAKTFAHGVVGGLSSKLSGGSFSKSFLSTGFVQFLSPGIDRIGVNSGGLGVAQRVGAAALIGGLSSKLAGGSFSVGARLGAMSRFFNGEFHLERAFKWFTKTVGRAFGALVHSDNAGVEIGNIQTGEGIDMTNPETWPSPPGTTGNVIGQPSRSKPLSRGELSVYDSTGREWRPHIPDNYHPEGHWNTKGPDPYDPWENIDVHGNNMDSG